MIPVVTKGSKLHRLISNYSRKALSRSLFCHYESTCPSCTRGYVVPNSEQNLFTKNVTRKKKEIFIDRFNINIRRSLSTEADLESINFEKISNETLESLSEYFDELIEKAAHLQDADVSAGDGVLTIKFGKEYGTYVINRQVPNQQIWLSSPKSGPKRYDFIEGTWIYKHDGKALHELLNEEIPAIVKFPVSFDKCSYCVKRKV